MQGIQEGIQTNILDVTESVKSNLHTKILLQNWVTCRNMTTHYLSSYTMNFAVHPAISQSSQIRGFEKNRLLLGL